MNPAPTDDELRSFVGSMLANLDQLLRARDVLDEVIDEHREMWVLLYGASLGFDSGAP